MRWQVLQYQVIIHDKTQNEDQRETLSQETYVQRVLEHGLLNHAAHILAVMRGRQQRARS